MIDELMKVGDEVVITIPQENRKWGYNPCPDGTRATILGFSEIHYGRLGNFGFKPGVYVNRAWTKVQLENGHEYSEYTGRLELTDKAEYERRLAAFRKHQQENPDNWQSKEFLRDLPETPFWEGDFVSTRGRSTVTSVYSEMPPDRDPDVFQIIGIDYHYLTEKTLVGTKYPAYKISSKLGAGWNTSASENDMVLVERGPVWKFFHDEPIVFGDIKEEAQFFESFGHTKEVRNPANGLYSWTKEEKTMKRTIISLFVVALLIPSLALAQGQGIKKSDKVVDTKFVLITSSLVASTVFDVETTFAGIKNHGVYESDSIAKIFVNAGRPATYALVSGIDTGIVYISYRMKKSENPILRKLWWIIPVTSTTKHTIDGSFNLRFVFR